MVLQCTWEREGAHLRSIFNLRIDRERKEKNMKAFGQNYLNFSDSSPTPFHCCKSASLLLEEAGFSRIAEDKPWELVKGRVFLN